MCVCHVRDDDVVVRFYSNNQYLLSSMHHLCIQFLTEDINDMELSSHGRIVRDMCLKKNNNKYMRLIWFSLKSVR